LFHICLPILKATNPANKINQKLTAVPIIAEALKAGANIDPVPGLVGTPLQYIRRPAGIDQLAMYLNQLWRRVKGRSKRLRKNIFNSKDAMENGRIKISM